MTNAFLDPRIDTDEAGTVAFMFWARGLAPSKGHSDYPIGRAYHGSPDYRIVLFPVLFRVIHLFYAWIYLEVVVTTEYDDCFQGVEVHVSNRRPCVHTLVFGFDRPWRTPCSLLVLRSTIASSVHSFVLVALHFKLIVKVALLSAACY